LKWWPVEAKAKGATVEQHRNRAKATVWKSARVQFAEAVRAQQPPGKTLLLSKNGSPLLKNNEDQYEAFKL
jgi:hypothetical protein